MDALACLVPPLILQPLVENAIRHGVSAVSSARTVEVSATIDAEALRLIVRDDGPGMSAVTPSPGSGTGIRNTRERLAQLYGTRAKLRFDASPAGTTAVVELPRSTAPAEDDGAGES
ncbi:MAG TPA: ATP-binding protein [Gemmatimonadaceae bacterium]|nr:ATP-binding protein [Gemmatimonadaceae bacterium]